MVFADITVVVPIDFSRRSDFAIQSGLSIAGDARKLHVVHVATLLESISPEGVLPELANERTDRGDAVLKNVKSLAADHGAAGAHCVVLYGDPGTRIAEYSAEIKADLIVIPSHGYQGLRRVVLGSVAERVIRHAECSVLVLRRPDAE